MITKLQNTILEMIARGAPLRETLDTLCLSVEEMAPDVVCSVLKLCDQGRLWSLSGPSLPQHYIEAIDGVTIGPDVGSCGAAAYTGQSIVITDIANHPYWAPFADLALGCGLRACWSTPIQLGDKVLGTFAFYFHTTRGPSTFEQHIVDTCTHLCAIAIERELRLEERQRLSETDPLTQLPNRGRFNALIQDCDKRKQPWSLLIADLDNLKLVNDRLGHQAGDELICEAARRIAREAPKGASFRMGGDEFGIIINGGRTEMNDLAARLIGSMKEACICAGQHLRSSMTIGGAVATEHDTPESMRQKADYALYHGKERGRGQFIEYAPGLGTAIARRFRSIQTLTDALRTDSIVPFYQPVVELSTGEIKGMEALCRLVLPDGNVVTAESFHEATRDGQAALELTQLMLTKVAIDARRWLDTGYDFGRVGINLSAADFCHDGLAERIATVFETAGVPLTKLTLEITESVYLDQRDQNIASQINAMRAMGMRVALDDFGTGFASLTHLLTVPVDMIKIDRTFVQRMVNESRGLVIIQGLVGIAKGLDMSVIAEGIETIDQAGLLLKLGCQIGQGYLFSKAVDYDAVTGLLKNHGKQVNRPRLLAASLTG